SSGSCAPHMLHISRRLTAAATAEEVEAANFTASACAAGIALGRPLEVAVAEAWAYVAEAIRRAPGLGHGHGPLDHGWRLRA
ncbi:MAG: bifunctional hydroxymethylpyrimidine kinase/phosphomethylpyrimidine kinase, partial [Brevundimonas sp.]|uniref:bifunctional hydroxymethylpyrimidine kinase/phosphomethylpyrimidine kinase n=1 Tax=Brevundimonas sp. TaxID=1871086 RepID=UPI004034536C